MKGRWAKYLVTGTLLALLAGCSSKPTDRGQQYKDGKLDQPLGLVNQPQRQRPPVNAQRLCRPGGADPVLFIGHVFAPVGHLQRD